VAREAVLNARPRWRDQLEAAGIAITDDVDIPSLSPVRASQQGLHDVLLNLIFNAVDAMPEGGAIHLVAEASGEEVTLKVSDTGQGMAESVKNRIFEPFFTTKTEIGTGLGLYTAYHTIQSFGGTIEVESEPGSGTAFIIKLNAALEITETGMDQHVPLAESQRCRILIVEDDVFVQDFLVTALGDQHDMVVHGSPASAGEALHSDTPDIVIADLGLPGIPGNQFLAQCAEKMPRASRVLMTGWNLESDDDRLEFADFYVQKPMDLNDLYDTVARAQKLAEERSIGKQTT
jgi:CheY-like chemotaxis protein